MSNFIHLVLLLDKIFQIRLNSSEVYIVPSLYHTKLDTCTSVPPSYFCKIASVNNGRLVILVH